MKEFKHETMVITKEAWKFLRNADRVKGGYSELTDEQLGRCNNRPVNQNKGVCKMSKKNKVSSLYIIVTGTLEKPYYEILYYDISDKVWHIGYSSYDLANVVKWKEEYFEVVDGLEDINCGKWQKDKKYHMFKCSKCGYRIYFGEDKYCRNCGSKNKRSD